MLAPGGWSGLTSRGNVMLIVHRTGQDMYSLVVCNPGHGLEYHPSTGSASDSDPPKIKHKTCLRMDSIPGSKIKDAGFWSLAFALWVKNPPSEYHRVEVLYDVLLPWLACHDPNQALTVNGKLLATRADPNADWRTPERANTSSTRCVIEALRYILKMHNIDNNQLKQLSYAIRREALIYAAEDLVKKYGRNTASAANAVKIAEEFGINPKEDEEEQEDPNQDHGNVITITSYDHWQDELTKAKDRLVVVDFFATWCGPCKQISPVFVNYSKRYTPDVVFLKVDVDKQPQISEECGIKSMPTFQAYANGKQVGQFSGASAEKLRQMIEDNKDLSSRQNPDKEEDTKQSKKEEVERPTSRRNKLLLLRTDLQLLKMGCQHLAYVALKEHDAKRLSNEGIRYVKQLTDIVLNLVDQLPQEAPVGGLPPVLDPHIKAPKNPYMDAHLLLLKSVEDYAGKSSDVTTPDLANLLGVPVKVSSIADIVTALVQSDTITDQLLKRTFESSTSSRLVLQMEVISFITNLFTKILPIPIPLDAPLSPKDIYRGAGPIMKEMQYSCLEKIHRLMLKVFL